MMQYGISHFLECSKHGVSILNKIVPDELSEY
jgi:hypothetical protein